MGERRGDGKRERGRGAPPGAVLLAGLGGAALVYLFEPDAGRRHRALLRDKAASFWRRGRRRARRLSRRGTHTLQGQWGRITRPGHSDEPVDSVTLTQRVESEVFRDPTLPKGRINVNAENGVIELRGQLDSAEQIERIVARVRQVPGVLDVANLMHLPGTPAPNKAAAIRASRETAAMPREQAQQPRYD
ncbi:MAG TPA: BON domain-containing protein [Dehalococcoidia bacterium]|nr:BON domain-containing protein [Dehalococcoidia bacterium]